MIRHYKYAKCLILTVIDAIDFRLLASITLLLVAGCWLIDTIITDIGKISCYKTEEIETLITQSEGSLRKVRR